MVATIDVKMRCFCPFFTKLDVPVKKTLIILILLCCAHFKAQASHIVGGDIYYDCVGGNTYTITVKLYRDCLSDGAGFDPNLPITIFNGSNVQIGNFSIPFPGSTLLDPDFNNECITLPTDICVEEAIYTRTITLPSSTNGYTLAYQRCCRGPGVTNLEVPEDIGLTLTVVIPPPELATCNSNARFNNYPPLVICANQEITFDHSATDPDGDELVYELCTPFTGGTSFLPAPDPATAPPYTPVTWAAGYSGTDPFGPGFLSIDASTGMLTGVAEVPGLYVVGVCVKEYRDGNLISTSTRDFLFKILNCEIELEADMLSQTQLPGFISFCQGLAVNFQNNSYGGEFYKWDFGVPGIDTDVSTEFSPSYTFPAPGTYEVTLVVNPGWPCTDTVTEIFIVNDTVTAEFVPPDPQCIVDNSFDFFGGGTYPDDGTSFIWDFGGASDPLTSDAENPSDIVFTTAGPHEVTYTVNYDVCTINHTEEIFVFAEPSILFSVPDELKCAPYTAKFTDLSFAHTPIYYDWDFGDGGTSTDQNPTHVYTEIGVYDVTLTIRTDSGCIDTLTLVREDLIELFPRPISKFTVAPDRQDEYHADFYFIDFSEDGVSQRFYFADGFTSDETEVWHNYSDPGVYYPFQIVTNEYGCTDRSYQQVTVVPIIPVIVPNAFTPDGNKYNNVFEPVFYEDQVYQLYIYNRWGELVYTANEYAATWDGTYIDGKIAPDGVYIWKIIYTEFDTGIPVEIKGHVTLLR